MKFYALKVASSGFPKDVVTDEQKQAYVTKVNKLLGDDLIQIDDVKKNSGLR